MPAQHPPARARSSARSSPCRIVLALLLAVHASLAAACGGRHTDSKPRDAVPRRASRPSDDQQTSGVTTLRGDDMNQVGAQRIEEYLNGRVPGLQVLRNESGQLSIRIRGSASLGRSDEEPLIIIDGIPTPQGSNSEALRVLDPRDVARVDVLKDASQTAMYGSRGANGVLVIRTRSGARRP